MKIEEYYVQLRHYYSHIELHEEIKTTITEIASCLYCSERNAKHILKKMINKQWIQWSSGGGRGYRSSLILKCHPEDILLQLSKQLFQSGNYKEAIELCQNTSPSFMEQFNRFLRTHFGRHCITDEKEPMDILRFPYYSEKNHFDPILYTCTSDLLFMTHLFEPLVKFNEDTQTIEPHLAYHWESNADCSQWTFYLNKNVMFHHGREMTVSDVKGTFERLKNSATMHKIFEDIMSIETNQNVIVFILHHSNDLFPYLLTCPRSSIVPMDIYSVEEIPYYGHPVGSGPFKFVSDDSSKVILEVHPDYFSVRPIIDRVELYKLPKQYMKNFHIINHSINQSHSKIIEEKAQLIEVTKISNGASFLSFNININGPQSHKKFREALYLAISREELATKYGFDHVIPANSLLESEPYEHDVTQDKEYSLQLLNEVGYSGEPIILLVPHLPYGNVFIEVANEIKRQCANVGINININNVHYDHTYEKLVQSHHMTLAGVGLNYNVVQSLYLAIQYSLKPYIQVMGEKHVSVVKNIISHVMSPNTSLIQKYQLMLQVEHSLLQDKLMMFLFRRKQTLYINQSMNVSGLNFNYYGQLSINKSFYGKVDRQSIKSK